MPSVPLYDFVAQNDAAAQMTVEMALLWIEIHVERCFVK